MKILQEDNFHELDYEKRRIIAGAVAKKFMEKMDEEELHYFLTKGLVSEWSHEAWGYDKYVADISWMNKNE